MVNPSVSAEVFTLRITEQPRSAGAEVQPGRGWLRHCTVNRAGAALAFRALATSAEVECGMYGFGEPW
jgi:hypothetical protein